MPMRDLTTGKELGGAEKARRKVAAAEPVDFGAIFAAQRKPPIGNPIDAMRWCNDTLLLCVHALMRLRTMSPADLTRLRMIMDGCAKAGMIRDKTAESHAMLAALRKRDEEKIAHGLEPNEHRPQPPPVPRPERRRWSGSC